MSGSVGSADVSFSVGADAVPVSCGSLYEETATAGPVTGAVGQDIEVGTLVTGGGITGLSAGLYLATAGESVAVVDAGAPGWGASGRNGGQVNPGLKMPPSGVESHLAPEAGRRLAVAAWNAPDLVFALIEKHGIRCDAVRGGTVRAATAGSQVPALDRLTEECLARGGDVAWLNRGEMAELTGTDRYCAGMIDRRGGQVNPLSYTRGLASAAIGRGAQVYSGTRIMSLTRDGGTWLAMTDSGYAIRCRNVVLATNGYTNGLWPGLSDSIVPVYSAIIATEPLPERLRAAILARREVLYELGEITVYYRVDEAGRLLIGRRSVSRPLVGAEAFPELRHLAHRLWPGLAGTGWTHGWNGQLAVTTDHYPHWHEPAPGVIACLGYNGRGVAMATLLGREVARRIQGVPAGELLLPPTRIRGIPLHRFWKAGVAARVALGRWRDRRQEGRAAGGEG
ncbi:NAD(P)/FAD-dependent oxidoreductase [Acetobacter musti]|uniref:NAD(P)/FAD-dependent oxidoreductase n=1 Tax=Acetobacter musti TaxID=864732 RepID=UPI0030CCD3BD